MLFGASPSHAIKIGIITGASQIGIGSSNETSIIDANTNKTVCKIDAMKGYELIPYKNTMAIRLNGKFYQIYSDNIVLKPAKDGFVNAKRKWYRGFLIIQNRNNIVYSNNIIHIGHTYKLSKSLFLNYYSSIRMHELFKF